MILPTKHINFSQSLLGLGAFVLLQLENPKSVDDLWENYSCAYRKKNYLAKHSFDNLVMSLLFLYNTGRIIENKGVIRKCS